MKKLVAASLTLFIFFCLMIATAGQASAYVDPGSGLIALQGLASAAAAFGYFMRRRILLLFRVNDTMKPAQTKDGSSGE